MEPVAAVQHQSQQHQQQSDTVLTTARVPFKEISAYMTLLEGGKPEDKLECKSSS